MKSGVIPVSSIAFTIANSSQGWPTANLNPVGLPCARRLIRSMKTSISMGVANTEWRAGDSTVTQGSTPRACAISGVTLGAGSTPPWPGLAPCESLSSTIFTWG